jgi:hypothetical protein
MTEAEAGETMANKTDVAETETAKEPMVEPHFWFRASFLLSVVNRLNAMQQPKVLWDPRKANMDSQAVSLLTDEAREIIHAMVRELGHSSLEGLIEDLEYKAGIKS